MKCPNCGWDNAEQNTRCERCDTPLGNESPSKLRSTVRDPIIVDQPAAPKKPANEPHKPGTINLWGGPQFEAPKKGIGRLTPMPSSPNDRCLSNGLELKDDYIELNRNNLDSDNNTISQRLQAVVTHKDGKWYIKDQSSFKTTFIQASEEVQLKDGDVILMGNRRFVFTEE